MLIRKTQKNKDITLCKSITTLFTKASAKASYIAARTDSNNTIKAYLAVEILPCVAAAYGIVAL